MSHLVSQRQKKLNSRITAVIIIGFVLLLILFQVGLKSIINSTVFINDIFDGKNNESSEKKPDDFYGILNVDEPDDATNSAKIIVSGDATEYTQVEYYLNNVKVESGKISTAGTFNKEIGTLKSGQNKLYVLAKTNDNKHEKQSDVFVIDYKNEKPSLEIESPKDGDKFSKNEIQIKGTTDKDVTVKVNNQPVVVDLSGNFISTYRLKDGENKIEISAQDSAGNVENKSLTVRYEKDE